jgi:hypothetical protein
MSFEAERLEEVVAAHAVLADENKALASNVQGLAEMCSTYDRRCAELTGLLARVLAWHEGKRDQTLIEEIREALR